MCSNINKYVRIVLCKHCVSGDIKSDVTKKQNSVMFCTEKVFKMVFWPKVLLGKEYFKSLNKMILPYKYFHWFGFDGCTLNCI